MPFGADAGNGSALGRWAAQAHGSTDTRLAQAPEYAQCWPRDASAGGIMEYGEYEYGDLYGDLGGGEPYYGADLGEYESGAAAAFKTSMQQWDRYVDNETLEEIGRERAPALIRSCMHQVWELSKSARYCRLVQHALELADEQGQVGLVSELQTRVIEATMDPHANHVLQRAIELMRPGAVNFVLRELMDHKKGTPDLAKHRYGCRVLERLIEHFPPHQLADLVNDMLCDAKSLIGHPFGNFVMQHLLEHGEQDHRRQLVGVLCRTTEELKWAAGHQHACSVLDKALSYGPPEEQQMLAQKVLAIEGLLPEMATQRGGFAATQRLFKVVSDSQQLLEKARAQLAQRAEDLLGSKHGRALAAQVYPELLDQPVTHVPSPSRARQGHAASRHPPGGYRYGRGGRGPSFAPRGFDPGGGAPFAGLVQ